MKLPTIGGVAALAAVLSAMPATALAQQVSVDASVRLSDDLIVGVTYGRPYVVRGRVYYHPHRVPIRRARVHRVLYRRHAHWHGDVAREHDRLHRALARGYISPRDHARWHRAAARDHAAVHHELDHKHRKAHRKGKR